MKIAKLEEAKFLLVSRVPEEPYKHRPSLEFIWKRTRRSITTIDVANFCEITYQIVIKKDGTVAFPNIPVVELGDYNHLYAVKDNIDKRRRALTTKMDERREALEQVVEEVKNFEEFCAKLKEKLPHDFKD